MTLIFDPELYQPDPVGVVFPDPDTWNVTRNWRV